MAQANAAAAFSEWLAREDGALALADVGLCPLRFTESGLLTPRNGVWPDARSTPTQCRAKYLTW